LPPGRACIWNLMLPLTRFRMQLFLKLPLPLLSGFSGVEGELIGIK
jgi:hypothetical protein